MTARVAVVTVAHGRHDHLARQDSSLARGTRRPDVRVLVAMADPALLTWRSPDGTVPATVGVAADPGRLPLAAARNRGAAHALALGAEVLVFLDVDCLAAPGLVAGYADVVAAHPERVWLGPVTYLPPGLDAWQLARPWLLDDPHPARPAPAEGEVVEDGRPEDFWSLSFACSASTWTRVGGFHEGYRGYGGEDTDLAFTARHRGVGLGWTGSARAYHQHHPVSDPPVEHTADIVRNARVFHARWGTWPMLGWLRALEERGLVSGEADRWEPVPPGAVAPRS